MKNDYKQITADKKIEVLAPAEELTIPLLQHSGTVAQLKVDKGQRVFKGSLLGEISSAISAKVHSPISGEVKEITNTLYPYTAKMVPAIKIVNDYQNTPAPEIQPYQDLSQLSSEQIITAVENAGIVGMGGATFPTHVKLRTAIEKKVDTVILNAAECEPYLTADYRILLEHSDELIYGLQAIQKAVSAPKIIIALEKNKIATLEKLSQTPFTIKILPTKYPTGAEKILVRKTTGRKVPLNKLPLDVGVLVINVSTVAQIGQTLTNGMPLIERVLTVSGDGFSNHGNYRACLGTPFEKIVKIAEKDYSNYSLVIGGPMMGLAISNLNYPVLKGSAGIILIKANLRTESPCIRCSKCFSVCPLGIDPHEQQTKLCMECGLCAYYCPANRQLSQRAKLLKAMKG